jgi:hypothetical protein
MTDYIDATLALPKIAPLAALIAAEDSPAPCALSGLGSHDDCGERDAAMIQTPNLRTRLDLAIRQARAATSRVEKREWEEEAQSILERLVDASAVCDCGTTYNLSTGQCDECIARQEQLTADRARFGVMALDIDPIAGF